MSEYCVKNIMYTDDSEIDETTYPISSQPRMKEQIISGIVDHGLLVGVVIPQACSADQQEYYCFDSACLEYESRFLDEYGNGFLGTYISKSWYIERVYINLGE